VHPRLRRVADYALVDQSGKMSVLGIFQHIWVQQFRRCIRACTSCSAQRETDGRSASTGVQIRLVDEADTELLGGSAR